MKCYIISELHFKLVAVSRTASSANTGSQTSTSTKTVSMPAVATHHNYNNYERNRKGDGIKQINFACASRNLIGRAGVNNSENKNRSRGSKTASQRISECQRDHLAFQAFLR